MTRKDRWIGGAGFMISGMLDAFVSTLLLNRERDAFAQETKELKVVRAQSFELVDETGMVRGLFDVKNGVAGLTILDGREKSRSGRVFLRVEKDGSTAITVKGGQDHGDRFRLEWDAEGKGGLGLYEHMDSLASLQMSVRSGRPTITMDDAKLNCLWKAP